MDGESLADALEREHHEIDEGITAFTTGSDVGRKELARAVSALRRHIYLEEEFVFPPLREAGLVGPVLVMLREHAQIWATLDSLEREVGAGGAGRGLCHHLSVQLLHHNLKEEKILYPQADTVLDPMATERLREFLRSGELPVGWMCQASR